MCKRFIKVELEAAVDVFLSSVVCANESPSVFDWKHFKSIKTVALWQLFCL